MNFDITSHGIKDVLFQHYAKGNSSLGSLIETCVKQIKYLIYKAIKTNVLDYFQFEFIIVKTVNLVNKRQIAFKEGLRTLLPDQLPVVITPELLVKGYEGTSINVIPELQPVDDDNDKDWELTTSINSEYDKLRKVRSRLV